LDQLKPIDTATMRVLLDSISDQMTKLSGSKTFEKQIHDKWFGYNPATKNDIRKAEDRLKVNLPHDYVEFLLISNGFRAFNSVEPTFLSIDRIDYLRNVDPELIKIWKQTGNDDVGEILEKSIIVAGIGEEQSFLLIPPDPQNKNWRYWKFAAWIPGAETYDNLKHYFSEVLDFMKSEK
jgi:cell wall assembly regulator SMI1